jgi:hypothetical protein
VIPLGIVFIRVPNRTKDSYFIIAYGIDQVIVEVILPTFSILLASREVGQISEPLTPETSELNNEDLFTIELSQLRKRNFASNIT